MMKKTWNIKAVAPVIAACMALSPVPALAAQEDITAVINAIDSLPTTDDLDETYALQVKDVWKAYQDLTTAEKLSVSNYEKLKNDYDQLVSDGIIEDEILSQQKEQEKIENDRNQTPDSGIVESQTTDYTFTLSSNTPSLSVTVRYTTDVNGDGNGDVPNRVVLTSPSGITTPVLNTVTKLNDDTMDVALTWTKNYLQMDFAEADFGKWTISTDIPVTFKSFDYAGSQQTIKPEDEPEKEEAEGVVGDETEEAEVEPEEESGGNSMILIGGLIAIVVMIAGLIFGFKKTGSSSSKPTNQSMRNKEAREKDKHEEEDTEIRPQSDEEIIAEMRKEYEERKALKEQQEEADENLLNNAVIDDGYDEDESVDLDDLEETIEEYREGDTGLLNQSMNPVNANENGRYIDFDDDDDPFA